MKSSGGECAAPGDIHSHTETNHLYTSSADEVGGSAGGEYAALVQYHARAACRFSTWIHFDRSCASFHFADEIGGTPAGEYTVLVRYQAPCMMPN